MTTLDDRLERLAPSGTVDLPRLEAARLDVLSRLDEVPDDVASPWETGSPGRWSAGPRVGRTLAAAAAAVAVVTTGLVLWTDVPGPAGPGALSDGDVDALRLECLSGAPAGAPVDPAEVRVVTAERRDGWNRLLLAGERNGGDFLVEACEIPVDDDNSDRGIISWFGQDELRPAADEVFRAGSGWYLSGEGEGEGMAVEYGYAGADVARVVLELEDREVEATLADGYYVAWWPRRTDEKEETATRCEPLEGASCRVVDRLAQTP